MDITKPCGPGKDFSTCPDFTNRTAHSMDAFKKTYSRRKCPKCDKDGKYDEAKLRMIKSTTYGTRIGDGPSRKGSSGYEIVCCGVM